VPNAQLPIERFESLTEIACCRHAFIRRVPGIEVTQAKTEALKRLDKMHHEIRDEIGMGCWPLFTAEQIHSDKIAIVDQRALQVKDRHKLMLDMEHEVVDASAAHFKGCDAMITNQRNILLGVYVADCCAVYILDRRSPAIGLVHSGKKGTELAIVAKAIEQMRAQFGSQPDELLVQLSPCIRPPHYETDFAMRITEQCHVQGVTQVHDTGVCTACHLDLYYSYRAEKGRTGRMLALLGLE
jgi:copper oxidase (laccase) domain-containing protein